MILRDAEASLGKGTGRQSPGGLFPHSQSLDGDSGGFFFSAERLAGTGPETLGGYRRSDLENEGVGTAAKRRARVTRHTLEEESA